MKICYIDLDDTIVDFSTPFKEKFNEGIKYPQSEHRFFEKLKPLPNAIESVNELRKKYDVYILTRPSIKNPLCYLEKRLWVEDYFGLEFCEKLILCCHKHLVIGDYLIDDVLCPKFKGEQLQFGSEKFPNWNRVMEYLKNR